MEYFSIMKAWAIEGSVKTLRVFALKGDFS